MNQYYINVHTVHEFLLERPPSVDSFNDRLTVQKVIFLSEEAAGVKCGDFKWNWYKKGPYSPSLTRMVYMNIEDSPEIDGWILRDEAKILLEPLKDIMFSAPKNMTETAWLELLASVKYLHQKKPEYNRAFQAISKELVAKKPQYNEEQAEYALNLLEEKNFLN